jgi:hypothetical protein
VLNQYWPTLHAVHVVAPSPWLFVIEPEVHAAHDTAPAVAEYVPSAHFVHEVAPDAAPVLVIEPASHPAQYDWPP